MHLLDTCSIAQHLKNHSFPTTEFRKILTDENNNIANKNYKFLRRSISEWKNPNSIKSISNLVLMHLNIFRYSIYLQTRMQCYNNTPVQIINTYKVLIYMQMLLRFYNIHTPDDQPRSGRKYLGKDWLWLFHQTNPAWHRKINSATGKDLHKHMSTKQVYSVQWNIYIYIYI